MIPVPLIRSLSDCVGFYLECSKIVVSLQLGLVRILVGGGDDTKTCIALVYQSLYIHSYLNVLKIGQRYVLNSVELFFKPVMGKIA